MTYVGRDRLMAAHTSLLERWRGVMNLVGPGAIDEQVDDCTKALDGLEASGRWVDLGTGAGFPGILLAAMHPDAEVELVDSRQKRCVFLEEVVETAGAGGVTVRNQRLEGLDPGVYNGVTARALAAPPDVLRMAARLLRPGGQVVLFLQDDADVEVPEGFSVVRERRYTTYGRARRSLTLRRDGS